MGHWIDNLARRLAGGGVTRRQALRSITGAVAGAAATSLASAVPTEAAQGGNSACAEFCQNLPPTQRGACVSAAAHGGGICFECGPLAPAPAPGTVRALCGGRCVTCGGGQLLNPTTCQCFCPTGTVLCNGRCTANVCSGGQVFNSTSCRCECPNGTVACNGECSNNICSNGQVFNPATCRCECPTGTVLCNGQCATNSCSNGQVFNPATCHCECPTNTVVCNGQCVTNTCAAGQTFNPTTCRCEAVCPQGQVFCGGQCVSATCPSGQTINLSTCRCGCATGGRYCVDTIPSLGVCCPPNSAGCCTDSYSRGQGCIVNGNCTCPPVCPAGSVCNPSYGICLPVCPPGQISCNGQCVNQCPPGQTLQPFTCVCR